MKKITKAALVLLLILSLLPFSVSAADDEAVSLSVADGRPVCYATLEQAMEAAQAEVGDSGDYAVLTLLRDVTVTETQEITCDIVIDLAGHAVSADNMAVFRVNGESAVLTMMNGSIKVTADEGFTGSYEDDDGSGYVTMVRDVTAIEAKHGAVILSQVKTDVSYVGLTDGVIEVNAVYADGTPESGDAADRPIRVTAEGCAFSAVISGGPRTVGRAYTVRSVGRGNVLYLTDTDITAQANYTAVALDIFNGEATVSGTGLLLGRTDGVNGWAEGICCYGGAHVYVNSGVTARGEAEGKDSLAYGAKCYNAGRRGTAVISADVVSELSVSGGNLEGHVTGAGSTAYGAYASGYGSITVSNGAVTAQRSNEGENAYGVYADTMGTARIAGGTVAARSSTESEGFTDAVFAHKGGAITVAGGMIRAENPNGFAWGIFATNRDKEEEGDEAAAETEVHILGGSIAAAGCDEAHSIAAEAYETTGNTARITIRGTEDTAVRGMLRSWTEAGRNGLTICGGWYDTDPSAYIQDISLDDGRKLYSASQAEGGYIVKALAEASWSPGSLEEAENNDSARYAVTFTDAVTAVAQALAENGPGRYTIRLLKNAALAGDMSIDTDNAYFTLDFCGHIIDLNGHTLTVSGEEDRQITAYSTGGSINGLQIRNGTLDVCGGAICAVSEDASTQAFAICAWENAEVNLTGGRVSASSGLSDCAAVFAGEGSVVRMDGGDATAEASVSRAEDIPGAAAGIIAHSAEVYVTGGRVMSSSSSGTGAVYSIYSSGGSLSVSGGFLCGKLYADGIYSVTGGQYTEDPGDLLSSDYHTKSLENDEYPWLVCHIPVLSVRTLALVSDTVQLDESTYYKVPDLISGQSYLLAVSGGQDTITALAASEEESSSLLWRFSLNSMAMSDSSTSSSLTNLEFSLKCASGSLGMASADRMPSPGEAPPADRRPPPGEKKPSGKKKDKGAVWNYDAERGTLSCTSDGVAQYVTYRPGTGFGCTEDPDSAACLLLFTAGPELGRCIVSQPEAVPYVLADSGYPAPQYSVTAVPQMIGPAAEWVVNGETCPDTACTLTADSLAGLASGVYPVSCVLSGRDTQGYYYRETSTTVNFIVANGVLPNSFLVFSDVHEEFENIGRAIAEVMADHDGNVPALVICTGDWVNGATVGRKELEDEYLPLINGQLGGLDTVYVAGNHDSGEAAANASVQARLGAEANDLADGIGVVFDSAVCTGSGNSSLEAGELIVYAVNYAALTGKEGTFTYAGMLPELESYLATLSQRYNGELIVIAAHAGLHVLGRQEEVTGSDGRSVEAWSGGNEYNPDRSDELAALLNRYAAAYQMDILFLFGHDHSKGETEFFLSRGDTLVSTVSYEERSMASAPLSFLYGHSGYLSEMFGSADRHYSLFTWDDSSIHRSYRQLDGTREESSFERFAQH